MRAIDGDALMAEINKRIKAAHDWYDESPSAEIKTRAEQAIATFCEISLTAKKMPTIEPERKKGKWIHVDRKKAYDRFCSECLEKCWYVGIGDYAFCPNCGADMRGGD